MRFAESLKKVERHMLELSVYIGLSFYWTAAEAIIYLQSVLRMAPQITGIKQFCLTSLKGAQSDGLGRNSI